MRDLVYIALTVGFFAVAGLLVAACDRIVGPDEPVTFDNIARCSIVAVLWRGYLIAALVAPERF